MLCALYLIDNIVGVLGVVYQMRCEINITEYVRKSETILDGNTKFMQDFTASEFSDFMKGNESQGIVSRKLYLLLGERDDNDKIIARLSYHNVNYSEIIKDDSIDVETSIGRDKQLLEMHTYFLLATECIFRDFMILIGKSYFEDWIDNEKVYNVKTVLRSDHYFHFGFHYAIPFSICQENIDDIISIANQLYDDENLYIPQATIFFVPKCENCGFLSYAGDDDICMIELYPGTCNPDRLAIAKKYEKLLIEKYNQTVGVSHWGYQWINDKTMYKTRKYWKNFDTFNDIRKEFDPNDLFLNDYLKNIFINESQVIDIEYPLIDDYDKNSSILTALSYCCLIVPAIIAIVYVCLVAFQKGPNYFDMQQMTQCKWTKISITVVLFTVFAQLCLIFVIVGIYRAS